MKLLFERQIEDKEEREEGSGEKKSGEKLGNGRRCWDGSRQFWRFVLCVLPYRQNWGHMILGEICRIPAQLSTQGC